MSNDCQRGQWSWGSGHVSFALEGPDGSIHDGGAISDSLSPVGNWRPFLRAAEVQGGSFMALEMEEHCAIHKCSGECEEKKELNQMQSPDIHLHICCWQKPYMVFLVITWPTTCQVGTCAMGYQSFTICCKLAEKSLCFHSILNCHHGNYGTLAEKGGDRSWWQALDRAPEMHISLLTPAPVTDGTQCSTWMKTLNLRELKSFPQIRTYSPGERGLSNTMPIMAYCVLL